MTNLFAWRDTLPENMKRSSHPVGPKNDEWLLDCAKGAGVIVAAWGKHGAFMNRAHNVLKLIPNVMALRLNDDGSPAHPLYLPKTLRPFAMNNENPH